MTNRIRLPKKNTNLLSVISLIVLFTMVFFTFISIASHCEELKKEAEASLEKVKQKHEASRKAYTTAILVIATYPIHRSRRKIVLALINAQKAQHQFEKARDECTEAIKKFRACVEEQANNGGGGCGSYA